MLFKLRSTQGGMRLQVNFLTEISRSPPLAVLALPYWQTRTTLRSSHPNAIQAVVSLHSSFTLFTPAFAFTFAKATMDKESYSGQRKLRRTKNAMAGKNGEGGIRTLDTLTGIPPFQGGALGHYATSPRFRYSYFKSN